MGVSIMASTDSVLNTDNCILCPRNCGINRDSGGKAVEYLFGSIGTKIYKVIFVLMIVSGALMTSSLAWDISDTFNGLMMMPNLVGVVALSPVVVKITRNYINRKIKGRDEEPMLSYDSEIQAEAAKAVAEGRE
jgi:AGCS family alanine or glycine:cation symporter